MQETLPANIQAGFRATGIHSLNPQNVVDKLPKDKRTENSEAWTSSLRQYLAESRSNLAPQSALKGNRLDFPAGRSVTMAALHRTATVPVAQTRKRKGRNNVQEEIHLLAEEQLNFNDVDPAGDLQPLISSDRASGASQVVPPNQTEADEDRIPLSDTSVIMPGDFVLVSVAAAARRIQYVGNVVENVNGISCQVKFLRLTKRRKEG